MKRSGRGFSLIELMVAMAIMGILMALAAPSYRLWISNGKIRTTAEVIQSGLQLARAEAVRRNDLVRFQLTSSTDSSCVLSTTTSNWVVSYDDPAGACDAGLLNEAFPVTDTTNNPAPRIIQARSAAEGSRDVVVSAGQSTFTFNGLGRVTAVGTNPALIDITTATASSCKADGGSAGVNTCLRVTVSLGGQIRMCDPYLTIIKPADSQAC
jgi:type IV fimbrial biogenesis protein FimT